MSQPLEDALTQYLIWHPRAVLETDVAIDWFADPACRDAFAAVVALVVRDGETFDGRVDGYMAVMRALPEMSRNVLEARGVTEDCEIVDYRRLVRELRVEYERREAIAHGQRLVASLRDGEMPRDVMERTVAALEDVCRGTAARLTSYRDAMVERAVAAMSTTGNRDLIPTGFGDLDRVIGGFPRGGITIIGARPGRGKSALLQQICEHVVAALTDAQALLASPEMASWEIGDRAVSRVTDVPMTALRNRLLTATQRDVLAGVSETAPDAFTRLTVYDEPQQTAMGIGRVARRIAMSDADLALIAVDYIQYLDEKRERDESRHGVIGRSMRLLKSVARNLDAACVVGAQLKRDAEDSEPTLAQLRESGDLEQDADVVILLGNATVLGTAWEVPLHVRKARQGALGDVLLRWDGEYTRFYCARCNGACDPQAHLTSVRVLGD